MEKNIAKTVFCLAIFSFAVWRVGNSTTIQSSGCGLPIPAQPHNGHSHRFYVQVEDSNMGSLERNYLLHVPQHYQRTNDVPVSLVLDYHGWFGTAASQQFKGSLSDVADEEKEETFIIVHLEGAGKNDQGNEVTNKGGMGSWNVSRTNGPLGAPCELPRPMGHDETCYMSCDSCDEKLSCDFSACYDDIEFTKEVVNDVSRTYCIDLDSIHMSGISNGGMFMYYAASEMSDTIASMAPISGAPFLGFDNIPHTPISVIDFHGTDDDTIPYDLNSKHSMGTGPYDTAISWDYYYYPGKPRVILDWTFSFDCNLDEQKHPTPMDGVDDWTCSIWSNCRDGVEIVHCNGNYGHDYPFGYEDEQYIGGTRILWNFMKTHKRTLLE